jgi:uridine kinase
VRRKAILELANAIAEIEVPHPTRVAIDGVGASGKTALADELASELSGTGREIIRASIDGFHNSCEIRYARGPTSPEGYLNDSFDYDALLSLLLRPLGPGGSLQYTSAVYDFRTESPVRSTPRSAGAGAILLFDGVFLLRPELDGVWDFTVFVAAGFDVTLARALERDVELFGSEQAVRERYLLRYIPGESLYLSRHGPRERADVVVENSEPDAATLFWRDRSDRRRPPAHGSSGDE